MSMNQENNADKDFTQRVLTPEETTNVVINIDNIKRKQETLDSGDLKLWVASIVIIILFSICERLHIF